MGQSDSAIYKSESLFVGTDAEFVSILARAEARALQCACSAMTFNTIQHSLREPQKSYFSKVCTIRLAR